MSKILKAPLLSLLLIGLLVGCQTKNQEYHATLLSFGTLINISFWDVDKDQADHAIQRLEQDLQFMHTAWHAWQPGPMGRVNMLLGTTKSFSANPSVIGPILKAQELAIASDHLFNPAISELIKLWGFHSDELPTGPPPAADKIKNLLTQNPRMDDISIDGIRMKSRNPHVKLDLGGVAKGYGIEQLIELLKKQGIQNAIVNAGGDLKVIGQHGDRPWKVGIQDPMNRQTVLASLDVHPGESVFTSGNYERFYDYEGRRYHHIIDPRTGYPAQGTRSVTLIHSDASTADAAATALFVAGPNDWQRLARQMGIRAVMLVDEQGEIHITPAMQARVSFIRPPDKLHVSKTN